MVERHTYFLTFFLVILVVFRQHQHDAKKLEDMNRRMLEYETRFNELQTQLRGVLDGSRPTVSGAGTSGAGLQPRVTRAMRKRTLGVSDGASNAKRKA